MMDIFEMPPTAGMDKRVYEANLRIEILERRVAGLESDLEKLIKILIENSKVGSQ